MDERLEAGRHHLVNGDRALKQGYPSDARAHFESALFQFRSPELRLGEAHAQRGLAQVALADGELSEAERRARAARRAYRELIEILDRVDHEGVSAQLRQDAEEGEASTLVVLGDILVRSARNEEARDALGRAREIYATLSQPPSEAGVWNALGRLAIREGRIETARHALDQSMNIHTVSGDLAGRVDVLLSHAELSRLEQDLQGAERALRKALPLAGDARSPRLQGRVHGALGSLMLQSLRLGEAREHYVEALPRVREAGDLEMEAYVLLGLGDVESRSGEPAALGRLHHAARLLGELQHQHGLAGALLRVSEHALRVSEPELSLVCAESARRLWASSDPIRGTGMALRMVVKSLAALGQWPAVLAASMARAALAGDVQPNAQAVADFYRARARDEVVRELDDLQPSALLGEAVTRIEAVVVQVLEPFGLELHVLGTSSGILGVLELLVQAEPESELPDGDWGLPDLDTDERPPTDEVHHPEPLAAPDPPPVEPPLQELEPAGELDVVDPELPVDPDAPTLPRAQRRVATEYDDLYASPDSDGDSDADGADSSDDGGPSTGTPHPEATVEHVVLEPEPVEDGDTVDREDTVEDDLELADAPPPDDYADFYDLPGDDD